jgi:hypothetical protein
LAEIHGGRSRLEQQAQALERALSAAEQPGLADLALLRRARELLAAAR